METPDSLTDHVPWPFPDWEFNGEKWVPILRPMRVKEPAHDLSDVEEAPF